MSDKERVSIYKSYVYGLRGTLPLSANIDMLLFLLGQKTCLRTQAKELHQIDLLQLWCAKFGFCFAMDSDSFVYIAADLTILQTTMATDHSSKAHEKEFGTLLGYPACCCEKIGQVGELSIDSFEEQLIQQSFLGRFWLINPCGYTKGKAFISHVPCSTSCVNSLHQAQKLMDFVLANQEEPVFKPWLERLNYLTTSAQTEKFSRDGH